MSQVQQQTCAIAAECHATVYKQPQRSWMSSRLLAAQRQTLPVAKVSKSFIQSRANWWRDTSILLNVCSNTGSAAAAAAAMTLVLQCQAPQHRMQHLLRTQHARAAATDDHALLCQSIMLAPMPLQQLCVWMPCLPQGARPTGLL